MRVWIVLLSFAIAITVRAECAGERWPVKVATDSDAASIRTSPIPTTIAVLRGFPATRPLPQDRRILPVETTTYSLTATLTEYKLEDDGEVTLILSDDAGRTLRAKIPSTACVTGSRFNVEISAARRTFDARLTANNGFQRAMVPVENSRRRVL